MAMILVKRGLTEQAYTNLSAGTPGTLEAITLGGPWRLRPYGPRRTGDAKGWSACHSSALHAQHSFAIAGGSLAETCGCFWAFYRPGPVFVTGGNNRIFLNSVQNAYGSGDTSAFKLNVVTGQLDIQSTNAVFPTQANVRTVPRHKNSAYCVGWQKKVNNLWDLRFMYLDPSLSSEIILYTAVDVQYFGTLMNLVYGGVQSEQGARVAMRFAYPSLYSMASLSDMAFPSDIVMPAQATWSIPSVENFHVSSAAAGGGDGTSLATAWTPAEARVEMATGNATVLSGAIVDSSNTPIDTKTLDADVLKLRMNNGQYQPTGSNVYHSDNAGPIRFTSNAGHQLKLTTAISGSVHKSNPALGRVATLRGTERHTSGWTLHAGNVYKKNIASDVGIVYEFDSVAQADIGDERRFLAHPTAANLAAYLAAATAGSFWMDGTTVYLWPTGSGNPNSNGKVYEVSISAATADGDTAGSDFWNVTGEDIIIEDLKMQLCGAVNKENSGGSPGMLGRTLVFIEGPGMGLWRRLILSDGGKHTTAHVPAKIATSAGHSRFIFHDSLVRDANPTDYVGVGGQSVLVEDAHNDGDDGQAYYENITVPTNAGQVGSTVGIVDALQPTMLQHNDADTQTPISKMWVITCSLPGLCEFGAVTQNLTVTGCDCGSAGVDIHFRAQNCTVTGNTIRGRTMYVGNGVNPSAAGVHSIQSDTIILGGAINAAGTIVGTATIAGNTIDASALTGDATKSLWTRGGVTVIAFNGNEILFNDAAAYRLFGTITPASGDALSMRYNLLQGADANRILVTAYAGANTKTLAQLQAGGQDVGSAWTADLKLGAGYKQKADSLGRGFVPLASAPSLAGTLDFNGKIRPSSGSTDAGALQYLSSDRSFARTRFGRSPRFSRV